MRVLVQRVEEARVLVAGEVVGTCESGLLLLVGLGAGDGLSEVDWMARKVAGLRIFSDSDGQMNRSILDTDGDILAVSQFTLYGDCRKGRRPSFVEALKPDEAEPLFESFIDRLRAEGVSRVEMGKFGAEMQVHLINDGPVTLWIEREASA
ncbi:MAG: D-aminoacyl-tRNA deacylase [Planctomycetota bacterium]|nr:D-aminoacyl-tRNA deacylase [Planctomycetota bacterium]